jgi:hypothetical protein
MTTTSTTTVPTLDPTALAAIETIVDLIGTGVEAVTDNALVASIVNAAEKWTPIIAQAAPQFIVQIENAISVLFGSSNLTADQVTALQSARASLEAARAAANAGS